jgi:formylmethanofuran dehydrogenase subunit D
MHKFRNGDKVSYKGEIVIVAQVYPCEDDCSIFIPSLGYERNVLVSNLTAVALEDFSKGALYEWNGALFESVPSKYCDAKTCINTFGIAM